MLTGTSCKNTCLISNELGKVTQETIVRLTKSVTANQPLECVYLVPMKRLTIDRQDLIEQNLKPNFT